MTNLVPGARRRSEPVIGLINIVFLMLVFFLLAGTIAPRPEVGLTLVRLSDAQSQPPRDALVLTAGGQLLHRGLPVDAASFVATLQGDDVARVMPDAAAPAAMLLATARTLAEAGASRVVIIGEGAPR